MKSNGNYGVSETIGFVIILGIVITGIGLVTLYGYPVLLKEQQNANFRNMERNMISLQNEVKGLVYKSVPYRETTLQVSGGTLSIDPSLPGSSFKIENSSSDTGPWNSILTPSEFSPKELSFESQDGDAVVLLENGAVIVRYWSDPTGSSMLAEPRWFYDATGNQTLVIPLIKLKTENGALSQSGMGNVQMKLESYDTRLVTLPSEYVRITYTPDITNNHAQAWHNYFVNSAKFQEKGSNTYMIYPVKNLVIQTYNVTLLSV